MVEKLDKNKIGVILGAFFAVIHALWSLLVLIGLAQKLMNFIFRLHFLNNPFTIKAFSLFTAIELIVVTFIVGYIFGWIFAWVWNVLHRAK